MLRETEKKISNTEKRTATLLTFLNRCNPSGSPSGSGPPTAGWECLDSRRRGDTWGCEGDGDWRIRPPWLPAQRSGPRSPSRSLGLSKNFSKKYGDESDSYMQRSVWICYCRYLTFRYAGRGNSGILSAFWRNLSLHFQIKENIYNFYINGLGHQIECKCFGQCSGSMTFWGGSGSSDLCFWLMDPDPDPDPGSGSCYFRHWSSRCQQKTNF